MKEGEPSTPSGSRPAPDVPASLSRHSRIHFPVDDKGVGRAGSSVQEGSSKFATIGLGPPPILRRSTLVPSSSSTADRRSRVRSVDVSAMFSEPAQHRKIPERNSKDVRRRTMTHLSGTGTRGVGSVRSEGALSDLGAGFSDEYALAQEDPGILEDVQRALKLKARREARLRSLQANTTRREFVSRSDNTPASSFSASSSPVQVSLPASTPPTSHVPGTSNESEIDFSPSVGTAPSLHPVPLSSDDGVTLDWTRSQSEDKQEHRRWTLSLTMGKSKERQSLPIGKGMMEKQDSLHIDKLSRIKAKARPNTLRKAAITGEQLQRRYNILYTSLASKSGPLNLSRVVGWYGNQEPVVQSSLDQAEPLTWLKHLLDKRGERTSSRLPWHVTALIAEEYMRSHARPEIMDAIVEESALAGSPSLQDVTPSFLSRSPISQYSLEPSLSRKRSFDGYVSFEPIVEPGREYLNKDPRRRGEGYTRHWRHSLPSVMDTPRSSFSSILTSSLKQHRAPQLSPSSSHGHLRDFARRRGRQAYGSDDGSSAPNSLSDGHARYEEGSTNEKAGRSHRPATLDLHSQGDSGTDREGIIISGASSETGDGLKSSVEGALTATISKSFNKSDGEATSRPTFQSTRSVTEGSFVPKLVTSRRTRVSLPPYDRLVLEEQQRRHHEADEEMERREYEVKAQMVEDAMSQNDRIRQLLQRVATGVKDYEYVRSSLSNLSGVTHESLPPKLIEAFSHDPAAVTGSTRRSKGWRAVEDIHNRIRRQDDTIRSFIPIIRSESKSDSAQSIFDDSMHGLHHSLEQLDRYRQEVQHRASMVAEMLAKVKGIHRKVKREYNHTLAHTSVVYDELSLIVRLEESYKDNYQQLWEFGMDALTFLLDTVTPFWRNYGKVIGEDVQDFLIIPWYRNEFTGEPKRYPIRRLPKRSFRHWLGLLLFFTLSVAVTVLQARAALFFFSWFRLPGITFGGLWWIVMPFFWLGVLIQCIAVLVEFSIVTAQMAVMVWWIGWQVRILT